MLLQTDVRENHRMDNPERLAILGTQVTGRRQTIQRHWQHWAHKTQDEDKQSRDTGNIGHTRHRTKTDKTQKHKTTQKNIKMNNTSSPRKKG